MNPHLTDSTASLHDQFERRATGHGLPDEHFVQDADAFAHVDQDLSDAEIDALWVAEQEAIDRVAKAMVEADLAKQKERILARDAAEAARCLSCSGTLDEVDDQHDEQHDHEQRHEVAAEEQVA